MKRIFNGYIFNGGLYPTQELFKYPKAGEDNSKVTLHLYDLRANKTIDVFFEKAYEYYPRIKWLSSSDNNQELIIFGMNRNQNELDILISQTDGSIELLFSEKDKYYIDINDNMTYLKNHDGFIWTSEKDGFNHIYIKSLKGKEDIQITRGNWEITNFYGVDDNNTIYFSSNESGSIYSSLYKVDLNNNDFKRILMTKSTGSNNITFSKGMKYFMNNYSDNSTPPYITLNRTSDGERIKILEDNYKFSEKLKEYNLSQKEFFTIETEPGVKLNAWMMKPTNFNPNKEYPLYMFLYGGPGSQQVKDS